MKGKMHAQIVKGWCPPNLQRPEGKKLTISYVPLPPYVVFDPFGGSDILIIDLLAKKLRFNPNFKLEKSYDVRLLNGTKHGLVHSVSEVKVALCLIDFKQQTI